MAECVKPIFGWAFSFVRDYVVEEIRALVMLEASANDLFKEMAALRDVRSDMERDVLARETHRMKRTNQVNTWLRSVDSLGREVDAFESSFVNRTSEAGCSSPLRSCWSNYQLGKSVVEKLRRVRELKAAGGQGSFTVLVSQVPPAVVVEVPTSSAPGASIVGGEISMSKIRRHLRNEEIRVIGIYGMGGIGKTTLLSRINNELLVTGIRDFDLVIWTTVSQDVNVFKIQEDIGVRLGYSRSREEPGPGNLLPQNQEEPGPRNLLPQNQDERAEILREALSRKRFLLLLDDVWETLHLTKIGIPLHGVQNRGKIAFTTRSEEVCRSMGCAQGMIRIDYLNVNESWQLFSENVGAEVDLNNQLIRPEAEMVAARCGGLPLALITVGRAMAGATTIGEWKEAVEILTNLPSQLHILGMDELVLSPLKFSFDRLEDESTKQCLLYCSLFPEDNDIEIKQIIEYWVGEGFLDTKHSDDIDNARTMGRRVVRKLKAACLLESGSNPDGYEDDEYVKMHDVVREMALWLTGGKFDEKNLFLVDVGGTGLKEQRVERWGDAKRISLMYNSIEELPGTRIPECPNVSTLLLCYNFGLFVFPKSLFQFTPVLRVLDLSLTNIRELPKEIGLLVELQYLNLRWTTIESLPKELGRLVKLRQLDLQRMHRFSTIPREAIVGLTSLQTLNLYDNKYFCWRN